MKPTASKISSKPYQCRDCGHTEQHSTNHFGAIYIRCRKCGWKNFMSIQVFDCLDECPEHMQKPEEWKIVKLGDIAEIG